MHTSDLLFIKWLTNIPSELFLLAYESVSRLAACVSQETYLGKISRATSAEIYFLAVCMTLMDGLVINERFPIR